MLEKTVISPDLGEGSIERFIELFPIDMKERFKKFPLRENKFTNLPDIDELTLIASRAEPSISYAFGLGLIYEAWKALQTE